MRASAGSAGGDRRADCGGRLPLGPSLGGRRPFEQLSFLYTKGIGYATEMNLRPQTLYGLADSPVALAAWMVDHDARSYEDIARAFVDEEPVGNLTRDEVLDNITMTWVTNTEPELFTTEVRAAFKSLR